MLLGKLATATTSSQFACLFVGMLAIHLTGNLKLPYKKTHTHTLAYITFLFFIIDIPLPFNGRHFSFIHEQINTTNTEATELAPLDCFYPYSAKSASAAGIGE